MTKPIVAVVHIYYADMWDELKRCLNNITLPYDLYVTTVEQNSYLKDDVINFKSDAHFEVVENRGYDVWPFIKVLQNINLNNYEFIIKLHTKRNTKTTNVNGYKFVDDEWRKSLLRFIDSVERFEKCLVRFKNDSSLGMVTSFECIHPMKKFKKVTKQARKHFPDYIFGLSDYNFVAGTMFMARASIFAPIQKMKISAEMFDVPDEKHTIQFAHVIERVLGEAVSFAGLEIKDVMSTDVERQKTKYFKDINITILGFSLLQIKITNSNKLIIKICKIPVFSKKLKKDENDKF